MVSHSFILQSNLKKVLDSDKAFKMKNLQQFFIQLAIAFAQFLEAAFIPTSS